MRYLWDVFEKEDLFYTMDKGARIPHLLVFTRGARMGRGHEEHFKFGGDYETNSCR